MASEIRQLVSQHLQHDPTAAGRLIDLVRNRVFCLCYRMLGQWQDAEDAAQETLWRALRHLSQWDPRRDFEPWLFTIAANRCRSSLARRGRRPPATPLDSEPPLDWSRQDQEAAQGLAEEVTRVLNGLPENWQRAFRMFHEDGADYQTIARDLQRPIGTIKSWVHRTRAALLDELTARDVVVARRSTTSAGRGPVMGQMTDRQVPGERPR